MPTPTPTRRPNGRSMGRPSSRCWRYMLGTRTRWNAGLGRADATPACALSIDPAGAAWQTWPLKFPVECMEALGMSVRLGWLVLLGVALAAAGCGTADKEAARDVVSAYLESCR